MATAVNGSKQDPASFENSIDCGERTERSCAMPQSDFTPYWDHGLRIDGTQAPSVRRPLQLRWYFTPDDPGDSRRSSWG
jgi:hypothetical protein